MKITVLLYERDKDAQSVRYILWPMCEVWRDQGHDVELVCGIDKPIHGDVVFLHIDLTVVPQEYLDAISGHPCVVNRRVPDISKTLISRHPVRSRRDWDGPVIVKTVRNYGGQPEKRLLPRGRFLRWRDLLVERGFLSLAFADVLHSHSYPLFDSTRDLPLGIFKNPSLIVERFLPELCGGLYVKRCYTFFGDRWINEFYTARKPIVSRAIAVERKEVPVPDEIVAARERLGFDYGKLDYLIHDGEVILFDINRTPSVSAFPDLQHSQGQRLAGGLSSFLASTAEGA